MNGVALLVALSALGVDHTWRSTKDGQVEYVLQVEPVFLDALVEGQEIKSELPAEMQRVDRICLRIASGSLKNLQRTAPDWPELNRSAERQAAEGAADVPMAVYVKAGDQAYESYDLTHGWLPSAKDASKYLVQIDPAFVKTLGDGDELYAAVLPEAGAVRSFVITAGRKVLPRESARPPVAVAQLQTQAGGASADPTLTDLTQPEGGSVYGDPNGTENSAGAAPAPFRGSGPSGWNITDSDEGKRQGDYAAGTTLQPPNTSLLEVPAFDHDQFPQRAGSGAPRGGGAGTGVTTPRSTAPRYAAQQPAPARSSERANNRQFEMDNAYQNEESPRVAARSTSASIGDDAPRRSTSASPGTATEKEPQFPALPFTLCLFALFLSIGGNLYLAWTAAEFYSRYKLAVERLRGASRG